MADKEMLTGAALVLTADAARARILAAVTPDSPLREYADLSNAEARLQERELVSSPTGRRNHQPTQGGHSAYGGGSMKRHRIEEFAASVCEGLQSALSATGAQRVYIVADPDFLGLLRQRMKPGLGRHVAGEYAKSLATETPERIRAALPARL